jgi:NADH dehydrogenase
MADTTGLIVGGGFAGVTCAQHLARNDVDVVLLDRNNYHQFQPMLYQFATAQIAAYDIARPLRGIFRHHKTVDVHRTAAVSIDPEARSVTTASGSVLSADYLVVAAGPEFDSHPAASPPLGEDRSDPASYRGVGETAGGLPQDPRYWLRRHDQEAG